MHTRCPHCQTLFRINEQQLRTANGQVRCCCCDNIFNAKKNLLSNHGSEIQSESISSHFDSLPDQPVGEPAGQEQTIPELFTLAEQDNPDSSEVSLIRNEQVHPGSSPAEKPIQHNQHPVPATGPNPVDRDTDIPLIEQRPVTGDPDHRPGEIPLNDAPPWAGNSPAESVPRGRHTVAWALAILVLLAMALGQISWFSREKLASIPEVRPLLQRICKQLDCQIPHWREPGQINIVSRSVMPHPETDQALEVLLVFDNQARFPQPYPQLQLEMYDGNGKLTARRRITPQEYAGESVSGRSLLRPGQSVSVELALEDPGKEIIGFKIEFL